ncbi:MAG: RhuM family protein [Aliarcobacter sp.]|nr:RhuM family protein [Aliarcobacter sp.]
MQELITNDNKSDIIIYNDGELELKVSLDNETVWLNRQQLSELFDRDIKTIGKHLSNIFKEEELEKVSTVANFATLQNEGGREVHREIEYYNLDVIISVGYRVKSKKGVRFRQWATKTLKNYILNGYVINKEKITQKRLTLLEEDVKYIMSQIQNNSLNPKQGIFYDGQIFDAYIFANDLLKLAKEEIVLIDNYIDESVFILFSKYASIKVKIYTKTITKQLKLDFQKYQLQYKNIELREFKNSHDRFLIIDKKEIYHLGASIKDLGKKWFAFSKFEFESLDILEKLK